MNRKLRLAKGAAAALRAAGVRVEFLDTTTHAVRREHAPEPWAAGPSVRVACSYLYPALIDRPADRVMVPWRQAWADCLAVDAAALTSGLPAKLRAPLVRRLLDDHEFARAHSAAVLLGGPDAGREFLRASALPKP